MNRNPLINRTLLVAASIAMLLSASSTRAGDEKNVGRDVGQIAPEIVGKDVNGKALKLSDFKGKVVVLDFFGDW